jgi:hypothetical protein
MSNADLGVSVSATPTIPTSFTTDSGTAIPSTNILDVKAISITDDNANGIQTRGGAQSQGAAGNDLEVQLTNRFQSSNSVLSGQTANLVTFALDAVNPAVYTFSVDVVGRGSGTGNGVGGTFWGVFKTDAATATLINTVDKVMQKDASLVDADVDLVASANNVLVQVTSSASENMTWEIVGTYLKV